MEDEKTQQELNEEKINSALLNSTKLHLSLKDRSFRNGYVLEIKKDFFIFCDEINGKEPIFFLELRNVEPYIEDIKKRGENGKEK